MWTSLRRVPAFVLISMLLTAMAYAGDGGGQGPLMRGPIFDITHFDVLPVNLGTPDSFEQTAYTALFAYRDASLSDAGSKSFRVVNWILASNHSHIIDVWSSLDAFEAHLAQKHSVDFRFAVQVQPPPAPPLFNCCIGSPIDDRQYSLVKSFNTPWTSASLAPDSVVGNQNLGLFVVTYVDFLADGDPGKGEYELVRYGAATSSKQSGQMSYTVLQQIDRPNRFATLEVWDSVSDYNAWQSNMTTTNFVVNVMPLLGSPLDHRLNILCGETYVDSTGCAPPP
jgi:quinol monooxygenase YgiN